MAEPLLSVKGLRVDYEDITAVDDVSFEVEAGMVYGLIGPNGAGKTSIIRVIATLLQPTYGQVRVCDVDLLTDPLRARITPAAFRSESAPRRREGSARLGDRSLSRGDDLACGYQPRSTHS